MKKILLLIVLALLTVAAPAQNYTFHGKKYDWKIVSKNCKFQVLKVDTIWRAAHHPIVSERIDLPLTIYLSKKGEVAVESEAHSIEYQVNPSKIILFNKGVVWMTDDTDSPYVSLFECGKGIVSDDTRVRDSYFVGDFSESQNQIHEIMTWMKGIKSSKPDTKDNPKEETGEIFDTVDKPAQFPGGDLACLEWIDHNVIYPTIALEQDLSGLVKVEFVVNVSGAIVDAKVVKSPYYIFSEPALQAVRAMPPWRPALKNGKPVRSRVQIPVIFQSLF